MIVCKGSWFQQRCRHIILSVSSVYMHSDPNRPIMCISCDNRSRAGTFSTSSFSSTQPLMLRQDSAVFTPGSGPQQFVFPFPSPPSMKRRNTSSSSSEESKHAAHHPSTAVPLAHSVAPIGHDYINSKGLVFMEDVHNFALQIACGLQHLASMQVQGCMYTSVCHCNICEL